MRKFLIAVVLLLALGMLITRGADVQKVVATLQTGHPLYLLLAVGVQVGWVISMARLYRSTYRLVGLRISTWHIWPLVVASNFVNVAAPSGGFGGLAVYITDARQHKLPSAHVTMAGILGVLTEYVGFLLVLALGFGILLQRNRLDPGEIAAALVLLTAACGVGGLVALGMYSTPLFERVVHRLAQFLNHLLRPLFGRDYIHEERIQLFATEIHEVFHLLRSDWRAYLPPLAYTLLGYSLYILILALTFLAFQANLDWGTIIAGFSIGYLFLVVSPTPYGIGFVEVLMPLGLVSLGVPAETATLITLAYRGLTFWLPFASGFVAFRIPQRRWDAQTPKPPP